MKTSSARFEIGGIDIREAGTCTCLRLRKATRRITQVYEHHLQAADVTIGQFGVLAYLFAMRGTGLKMGALANHLQVDPTTLKRTLGPLLARTLIVTRVDPSDRRARVIAITDAGCAALRNAIPFWQQAQQALGDTLGGRDKKDLDRALDRTLDHLSEG